MVLLSDKDNESSFKYTPSLLGEVMSCTSFFSSKEEEESLDGRPLYVPEISFLRDQGILESMEGCIFIFSSFSYLRMIEILKSSESLCSILELKCRAMKFYYITQSVKNQL